MKFKIDENLPVEFAVVLRESGYQADTVGDEALSGAADSVVIERCRLEDRVLLTLDLGFANIQAYPTGSHAGIVVVRTKRQDKIELLMILGRLLPVLKTRSAHGQLWIVEQDRIRFRVAPDLG